MTWVAPTIADFKTRFPQFTSTEDATVQALLNEAVLDVGETWIERDRTPGVLHLAAHLLSVQISGASSAGGGGDVSTGVVKRRKVGDVEIEYAVTASAIAAATANPASGIGAFASYYTTAYGRRYVELVRRNFPAIAVV